ncbi:MAG: ABC transporter ATP-binding protein [Chloroflexi bacterium]|nr:ABC transporter ATP-binding protein [Chloroflexota bacterium]
MPLLEVENLHTYYGNIHALKGISLNVEQGEIVSLIGSNGAGKTTALRSICGLNKIQKGRVSFNGKDIQNIPPHKVTQLGVTMVPEGRGVFARLTVQENLEMGAYTRHGKAEILADMEQQFVLFPRLKDRRRQLAGTLSGGEQQMLAMARALMARPRLLLMDEPSMGLAPILVDEVFELILTINKENMTILLVEQNALKALSVASRGYVIQSGEIVLQDTSQNLLQNEMMQKVYLGAK